MTRLKNNIQPSITESANFTQQSAHKHKLFVFTGLGLLLIVIGLVLTPNPTEIINGFASLITSYNVLDMNSFMQVNGALGVPFINSGILVLCVIISYILTKAEIKGAEIAAVLMTMGFAFCGKTIFNVWPIIFGTLMHSLVHHKDLSKGICTSWFACSLTPIVNLTAFHNLLHPTMPTPEAPVWSIGSIALAFLAGTVAGYIVGFFSVMLPKKHDHYTLYNVGFAAGLSSLMIYSYLRSVNFLVVAPPHQYPDIDNTKLLACAIIILLYLGICGVILCNGKYSMIPKVFKDNADHDDHSSKEFFAASLIHMAVIGLLCLGYTLLMFSNMSGAHYAAFFTIAGFAANGITILTALPLVLGVTVTSFVTGGFKGFFGGMNFIASGFEYASSKSMVVTALYASGMAPFVRRHGALSGFIMASIHSVLVPIIAPIQGWLNLYSNGFSTGLISTFYAALVERFVRTATVHFRWKKPWDENQENTQH